MSKANYAGMERDDIWLDGYSRGAKETKERILIAIKMAGGMAEQFGNQVKAETVAHIYVLIEALPIDTAAEQEGEVE